MIQGGLGAQVEHIQKLAEIEYYNHIRVFISVYSPETQSQSFFRNHECFISTEGVSPPPQSQPSCTAIFLSSSVVYFYFLSNYRSNTKGLKTTLIYHHLKLLRRPVREPVLVSGRRIFHPILINWMDGWIERSWALQLPNAMLQLLQQLIPEDADESSEELHRDLFLNHT